MCMFLITNPRYCHNLARHGKTLYLYYNKPPSQDLESYYKVTSKSFLPKLYGDYRFWNPSPITEEVFLIPVQFHMAV
ncbi:unnamed protein product [Eruca vesicaria subsp. sativa]|uniref:Uncharacterized protein n=1 Tax=Eruca vesicaria subsp. sativa TaxID=29727 RepID=A0ABC8LDR8_ERUVS|nr:unnamed protein product [Eruca vesicaria subsp. sativa]